MKSSIRLVCENLYKYFDQTKHGFTPCGIKIKKNRPISRTSGIKLKHMQIEISTEKSLTDELALLYASLDYEECDAFGEYVLSGDNTCMTKLIAKVEVGNG